MTEFDAIYYDGKTSARNVVRVRVLGEKLYIAGTTVNLEVTLASTSVDSPLAGTRRAIHLPGGAQLQIDDHAAVEDLFPRANRLERWVHGLERRWPHALAGLVVVVAG